MEYFDIYSRHQREIDDALSAYGQRRAYRGGGEAARRCLLDAGRLHPWRGRGRQDQVRERDFITGGDLVRRTGHGERWQVYRAATRNPLDDWRGEEMHAA